MSHSPTPLFVWRGATDVSSLFNPWGGWSWRCPFCSIDLAETATREIQQGTIAGGTESERYRVCPLCGWIHMSYDFDEPGSMSHGLRYFASTMRCVSLSDNALALDELGTHLRRCFSDVFALSWERFEDLAADVFRRIQEYEVIQTVRSGDGGADLLILSGDGRTVSSIVECKKYAPERRIGVAYVRQLVGACVDWDTRRATLLTTSTFTEGAHALQRRYASRGFELSLADGTELLKLLGCYNCSLPPLGTLSGADVEALIASNSRALEYTLVVPKESMVHEREDGGYEFVTVHSKAHIEDETHQHRRRRAQWRRWTLQLIRKQMRSSSNYGVQPTPSSARSCLVLSEPSCCADAYKRPVFLYLDGA
jgi:hypothetical protein